MGITTTPGYRKKLSEILADLGNIEHDMIHRPRPYPYDVSVSLILNDGGAANVFGAYTQLIPINTFDFGDPPNRIQILALCICDISANGSYLLEFYRYVGTTYTVLGAVRFRRTAPFTRTFFIRNPCRPLGNDHAALYGRVKSDLATGESVTFALHVAHFIPTSYRIPVTTGVWPFG